jgi:ABC-2 type transport system ATP-binding protein
VSVISVSGLGKSYGRHEVLHGISFTVEAGEVFGLLGPNGAGKTTTVEILEGYRGRDGGDVRVLGQDPGGAGPDYRARIGIVLQSSAVYPVLSVRETLDLFAGYYPHPRRPEEVIELVGLTDKADARVRTLSGGQLRRLDLALALIGDPDLIFLDEPTTGFDPAARRHAWETIRDLRELGKSILLTTHYMEEAQRLSDRIAILGEGRIVATGSPEELLSGHGVVEIRFRRNGEQSVIATTEPTRVLHELTSEALAAGVELEGLEVHRRTLEDVYLELTREEAEV